ncbi:hypothetical protein EYF80_005603 [Liparis tanakae]|uniref:Uncharacterized protein n=1 Tax=Liparis tanakae TaxID=230148 RepID=A0A4Z2J268_9TELE|nr:hypothetical protein EYF80_005603 [Liparis tanakae]
MLATRLQRLTCGEAGRSDRNVIESNVGVGAFLPHSRHLHVESGAKHIPYQGGGRRPVLFDGHQQRAVEVSVKEQEVPWGRTIEKLVSSDSSPGRVMGGHGPATGIRNPACGQCPIYFLIAPSRVLGCTQQVDKLARLTNALSTDRSRRSESYSLGHLYVLMDTFSDRLVKHTLCTFFVLDCSFKPEEGLRCLPPPPHCLLLLTASSSLPRAHLLLLPFAILSLAACALR